MAKLACPGCGKQYRFRPTDAGGQFRCTRCQLVVTIPSAAEVYSPAQGGDPDAVVVPCPSCRKDIDLPTNQLDSWVVCPTCALIFHAAPAVPPHDPWPTSPDPSTHTQDEEPADDGEDSPLLRQYRRRQLRRQVRFWVLTISLACVLIVGGAGLIRASRDTRSVRQPEDRVATGPTNPPLGRTRPVTPAASKAPEQPPKPVVSESQASVGDIAEVLGTLAGLAVGGFVVLVIIVAVTRTNECPRCGRNDAIRRVWRKVVERKKCFGVVIRRSTANGRGWAMGGPGVGPIPVLVSGTSEREERAPVIRTTYKERYRCRYCQKGWSEFYTEEVEDPEPDAPLPPE